MTSHQHNVLFALEMKWAKKPKVPRLKDDIEKLKKFREANQDAEGFLCVFGVMSVLQHFVVPNHVKERGDAVYADLRKTKYGCRMFEVKA